jgi:hypothetical protein
MEVVIPLFALSSLYLITNQNKNKENFSSRGEGKLPNVDIPNRNYPGDNPVLSETDVTSELSTINAFDNGGGVYTDKYFNSNTNISSLIKQPNTTQTTNPDTQYFSLTGNKVDGSYFQHNNMVPFFGSRLRNQHVGSNINEGILDNYSGAGSQIITKKEQSPLFAPHDSLQWANGAPNQSDFMQSRVNPSLRMANVKPFEEKSVGPGLGLGYTAEGSGGFNSGLLAREQWMDKTVDQLRVDNKPRASGYTLLGHEGPADSFIKYNATVEQMGIMEKHLPDQSFEMGQDRLFTTTGIRKGESLIPIPVERHVNRPDTTSNYIGAAGSQNNNVYVTGEYMPTHMQELGGLPFAPANAGGRFYANDGDYGIKSKMAYPNNRTVNTQDSYFGVVSGGLNAAIAPLLDILRPSRKENTIGTLRPYQNPGSTVANSYIFNPADKTPTTIRETTENSKFHLNVNANQNGGAYQVTENQLSNTYRQETSDFYYAGVASAGDRTKQPTSYEANYNQRNNDIKSSTIKGHMVQGNMALMNGDINMRQDKRDEIFKNNRAVTGKMPSQSPSIDNIGSLAGNTGNGLYSTIQLDRNTPDITNMLKSNPFVVDYRNAI